MTRKNQRRQTRQTHRKRTPSGGVLGKILIMLAVVAAVVFGVAIFFKVGTVEVQGNSMYGASQIIEASGVEVGDNLLTVNKATVAGNIKALLPYVQSVSIGRSLPDAIIIKVEESQTAFAVTTDTNAVWLISASGKALERRDDLHLNAPDAQKPAKTETDEAEPCPYPQIIGLVLKNPTAGTQVTATDEAALSSALAVLREFDGTGLLSHIRNINVEKDYNIVVQYDSKYEIQLGGSDRMDYKVQYLLAILEQLSAYQSGTIDLTLSEENSARFYPKA